MLRVEKAWYVEYVHCTYIPHEIQINGRPKFYNQISIISTEKKYRTCGATCYPHYFKVFVEAVIFMIYFILYV